MTEGSTGAADVDAPGSPSRRDDRRLHVLIGCVLAAGALSFVTAVLGATGSDGPRWSALAVCLALFVAGDVALLHIRFGHNQHSFTWSETAMVIALVLLPEPWPRLVAPAAVACAHTLARRGGLKIAFNTASVAMEALLASAVFGLLTGPDPAAGSPRTWVALGAAALSFFAWNGITVAAAVAFSEGVPFRRVYAKGLLLNGLVALGNTGTGILLVATAASASPAMFAVVPVLVVLLYLEYRSYLRAMNERDTWKVLQVTSSELLRMEPAEVAQVVLERTPGLFQADLVELLVVDGEVPHGACLYRWSSTRGIERHYGVPEELAAPYWPWAVCEREPFEVVAASAPAAQRDELQSLGVASCVVARSSPSRAVWARSGSGSGVRSASAPASARCSPRTPTMWARRCTTPACSARCAAPPSTTPSPGSRTARSCSTASATPSRSCPGAPGASPCSSATSTGSR